MLMQAAVIAAFMSTVDTHINWGASYLASDLYQRFFRPQAGQSEFVIVSRVSVVFLSIAAVLVASQIDQIGDMWKFYFAMMAGLGVPHILRWLWWRPNAWTEIAGMTTGIALSVPAYALGWADAWPAEYVVGLIAVASAVVSIGVTLLTPPVPREQLRAFAERVRPVGFWAGLSSASREELWRRLGAWLLGVVSLYAALLGIGWWLQFAWVAAVASSALAIGTGWAAWGQLARVACQSHEL